MFRSVLRVLTILVLAWSPVLLGPPGLYAQDAGRGDRVSVIQMPYTGARNVPELSDNPEYLYRHGVTDIQHITTDDIRHRPDIVRAHIERLGHATDVIYVHIDMDVLAPEEVPGHPLTVDDGPTSLELGAALTEMSLAAMTAPKDFCRPSVSRSAVI